MNIVQSQAAFNTFLKSPCDFCAVFILFVFSLASRAQVNSLLAVDKELYIGTSFGCILVCNNLSLMVYTIIRCHDESVRHLLPLVTTPVITSHSASEQTKALVLSCGRGYRSLGASLYGHTSYPSRRSGKTSLKSESVVLVWLADAWESWCRRNAVEINVGPGK